MEHAPPDRQYGHKEIAAFTDLSAVGPDPLDELAGTHHADGRRSALGSSVNVARLDQFRLAWKFRTGKASRSRL